MRHIYVAGPYTAPDADGVLVNVQRAIDAGNRLLDAGLWPHVPHLTHYLHERRARDYEAWMRLDFAIVERMDALLRLPGPSSGADREVELANQLGLPVFTDEQSVIEWARMSAGGTW
jgi:hypothetical protein